MKIITLLFLAATLTGCAFGQKHDYLQARPTLSYPSKAPLAVGVQDRRPYILDHDKTEDFVGLQRGGYGNPFDVDTQSGQPLATDMAKALAGSLGGATVVPLSPSLAHADAVRSLQSFGTPSALLLTLREWKVDTMVGATLHYDVTLEAIAADGAVLAEKSIKGRDELGSNFWNVTGYAREAAPAAFQRKAEELFNGPVAQALRDKP